MPEPPDEASSGGDYAGGPRMAPHNLEAEEAVLGSILINPEAYFDVAQFLKAEDFYLHKNGWIWEAFVALNDQRIPVDFLTVQEELERHHRLAEAGGPAYLTALINNVPTSLHAEAYGRIVEQASIRRKLLAAANDIAKLAYQQATDISEVMDRAEQAVFGVSERRLTTELQPIKQVISAYYDRVDYLARHKDERMGVPTGFIDLDRLLGGLQKSDLLIIAGRPGTGKCVTADTHIANPRSGELFTVEELVRSQKAHLLTLSDRLKLEPTEATNFVDDGLKPVYRVRTALGREIKVTLSHPFLTIDGWRSLGDLAIGDRLAVPRVIPIFGNDDQPEHKVKILAYLLADGNMTGMSPRFTNSDPRLRDDFAAAALIFPGVKVRLSDMHGQRTPTVYITSDLDLVKAGRKAFAHQLTQAMQRNGLPEQKLAEALGVSPALVAQWEAGKCAPSSQTFTQLYRLLGVSAEQLACDGLAAMSWKGPNSLRMWLQEVGVWGKAAAEKDIPACVYRLTRQKLALFLNRLFACDGSIYIHRGRQAIISYATSSPKLARSVQHLLLRFGIVARLRYRQVKYQDSRRDAYELLIIGATNILSFIEQIDAFGKEQAINKVREQIAKTVPNPNRDVIPVEVWASIEQIKGERTWRSVYDEMGLPAKSNVHVGKRAPSRQRLLAIGQAFDSDQLINLAQSDVYWDQIISIEYLGERQVYDLTVPGTHNFVADDMIVHNTAFMLSAARHAAQVHKKHVAIFSLEMANEQLVQRLVSQETEINSQRLRLGELGDDEWPFFTQAVGVLGEAPIFLDDTPGITPMQLRTKCRRLHAEFGVDLIIVDYLQLMSGGLRAENRQQEVSMISRNLKNLARELKVPILAGSQLSRELEKRAEKRPQLSDLRESGSLEQDADIVMFIYREEMYDQDTVNKNVAEIIVAKHRNGPTDSVKLVFRDKLAKFENAATRRVSA